MNYSESIEAESIRSSIQEYIDGVVERNFPKAESPWHPEGLKIYLDSENNLKKITMIQSKPKDISIKEASQLSLVEQSGCIENIEQSGNAAIVKVKWLEKRGQKKREYTDYISLLKIKNDWKIVAKIFSIQDLS